MRSVLALLVLLAPLHAEPSAKKLAAIDAAIKARVAKGQVKGAVTLVAHKGKIVYFAAHGEAAPGVPMRKDTIFRIYSMTKPVTSVAAMMLVEEGKLVLDAPVSKYIPAFADLTVNGGGKPKREMTVRDLFRHTSGLTYGFLGNTVVDQQYRKAGVLRSESLEAMVAKLATIPLVYEPGTRFNYSVSTDVLARIVEVVSKKRFDVFLKERIFEPLKMVDTGFFVPEEKHGRFAASYNAGGKVIDDPRTGRFSKAGTMLSGGGGLVSTAQDFAAFCLMLRNKGTFGDKRLLKEEAVAAMTRNQLPEGVPVKLGLFTWAGVGFGLGFSVRVKADQPGSLGEYGWAGAASTNFWIAPEADVIFINMIQKMPLDVTMDAQLKPLVYDAIEGK